MSYDYQEERTKLFTDKGQRRFLQIRDRTLRLIREAGAVRLQEAIKESTGESWLMLACIDRMVELGEIVEVHQENIVSQDRIFTVREYRGH